MKMPMTDQSHEHRGPSEHKQQKFVKNDSAVKADAKSGPGHAGMKSGGIAHACATLRGMKE